MKDSDEMQREMTDQERSKFGVVKSQSSSSSSSGWKYERPKEESIKITVKKKKLQDTKDEEMKENS